MFDHLDDPRPPVFDERFHRAVVRRALRRRRSRRAMRGAGAVLATLVVTVGGIYGRAVWRANDIQRVDVAGTAPAAVGAPVTVLVVGTDGHAGSGTAGRGRTDTLLLAHVDPAAGTAALLSLPRDLMVDPPGGGEATMISAVASDNGVGELVTVIESQLGIPVDHVVVVDLDGFRSLVDRLGGIDVRVDAPVRDDRSGLYLDDLGCVTLDGEQALALVRSRKVEVLDETGTWVRDPLADLGRVGIQRQVLLAVLAGVRQERPDPVTLNRHVDWAVEHVTLDAELGRDELLRLARAAVALDPAAVSQGTLPVLPYPADENRLVADPERTPEAVTAFVSGQPLPAAGGRPGGPVPDAGDSRLPGGAVVDPC